MENKETKVVTVEPVSQTPQPVVKSQENTVEGFISQAIEKGLPIETIERFLQMRKECRADHAREAFIMAMAQFQRECPVIAKTKEVRDKNGKVVYKYAPLDSIVLQVKEALGNNNLSYNFREVRSEDGTKLTAICSIRHAIGHSEDSEFTVNVGSEAFMTDTQKYGARNTFAKRYAFMNALGILTGDEDTDAREIIKKPQAVVAPALAPKVRIVAMLKHLGLTDVTDKEVVREAVLKYTGLEPLPENFDAIIDRLTSIINTEHEDN